MRQLMDKLYKLVIAVHVFANRGRVKSAGSLLYMVVAIVVSLTKNQLRIVARTLLQTQYAVQLKLLLVSGMSNLGAVIQQAETMFR